MLHTLHLLLSLPGDTWLDTVAVITTNNYRPPQRELGDFETFSFHGKFPSVLVLDYHVEYPGTISLSFVTGFYKSGEEWMR